MKRKKHFPIKVVITAGPTIEPLDPVRYISNHSSGLMGYALAEECVRRGHRVCLVSGPVALEPPRAARVIRVTTAREMKQAVMKETAKADCVIMAAAVCDFRPTAAAKNKIKKKGRMTLELARNPDILKGISARKGLVKVGFALETGSLVQRAKAKMKDKKLDLIVANAKTPGNDPFGPGKKDIKLIDAGGSITALSGLGKRACAKRIIARVEGLWA